ncbi:MAG: hypothetical protein KGS45_09790 [Planctomycetes bacterium]|nr:hypothetical protein [Planctomycetota bacterium]
MKRETLTQLIAGTVAAASLASSGVVATSLSATAGRAKLVYTQRAEEGQPPQVALGIAMGAFRGIFVNFLWIRANNLKEAGKYHESIELARAITKLQPRFPRVWVFHAWNMAYNISVATQTKQERYNWVNAGINLLRDEGIPANPNDTLIHKELGWIFLHKIQGYTDDANMYYKQQVAAEWQVIMGEPPKIDFKNRGRDVVIKQYADWIRGFVDAPDTLKKLNEVDPVAGAMYQRVRDIIGDELGMNLLTRVEMINAMNKSVLKPIMSEKMSNKSRAIATIMDNTEERPALDTVVRMVRKHVLVSKYNMEPDRMLRYTRLFGPIDWRHPAAHGLYWSFRGSEQGKMRWNDANHLDFDFVNTDRITIHSLQELWRSGELYFDFVQAANGQAGTYLGIPNSYFVQSYGDIVYRLADDSWADNRGTRAFTSYGAGYENFLKDATRFFYRRGERDVAEKYLSYLRQIPIQNLNNPDRKYELSDLDKFVEQELKDRQTSPDVAVQEVVGSLMDGFQKGLLGRDTEGYRAAVDYARAFHGNYMAQQLKDLIVGARTEKMPRDFNEVAGVVFSQFIEMLSPDEAETAYAGADDELRRWAFDKLKGIYSELYAQAAEKGGRTFATVFPEPPGMDLFRAQRQRVMEQRSQDRGDVKEK